MRQCGGQINENHYPDRDRSPYPTNLEAKGPKSGRKIEGSHQCCGKNKAVQKDKGVGRRTPPMVRDKRSERQERHVRRYIVLRDK